MLLLSLCRVSLYARTARVYGYVVDQDNVGIELANVAAWTAPQPPEGGETVPASEVRTVAVVAPLSDAAKGLQLLRYVKKNNSF